ncbi:MAG: Membrane protein insertase YidC [Bacteriovoracaceae bacterium]|nr:Membrane protein insertase YidC [Bacteriovoracaceae bacterium]
MDNKTIIAFALMIVIYIFFFQKPVQQPASISTNTINSTSPTLPSLDQKKAEKLDPIKEKIYQLQNENLQIELNGVGTIEHSSFLKYKKAVGSKDPVETSFPDGFNESFLQTPAGLVKWSSSTQTDQTITLHGKSGDLLVERQIQLSPDNYLVHFSDDLTNSGSQSTKAIARVKLTHPPLPEVPSTSFLSKIFMPRAEIYEVVSEVDGSIWREPFLKINHPLEKSGQVLWTGFAQKYFYYGFIPQNVSATTLKLDNQKDVGYLGELALSEKVLAPGEKANYSYQFYVGPKDLSELKKAAPELTEVVDYGSWIGPIARLLLSILHMFYKIIPNYGVGIILLTILVKVVLFPLAFKSAVSMRRLQVVQPKMKEIRDKYKNDKQRMNTEMMALYKTEKVNPVGGCLPIFLQMPVFFSLYRVFYASIEFRQAPFFGWINDLSAHDPYFVTPILMTALMWYQTKLTPQPPAMEETEAVQVQRAMMKWMPIVFGAIMIFLPSGLTLYFLVNALLSLIQQLYLNKHLHLKFPLAGKAIKT